MPGGLLGRAKAMIRYDFPRCRALGGTGFSKVLRITLKWLSGEAFASTRALGRAGVVSRWGRCGCHFSDVCIRKSYGLHLIRQRPGTAGQKSSLDRTGASGSHVSRFRQKTPQERFSVRFRHLFGLSSEALQAFLLSG